MMVLGKFSAPTTPCIRVHGLDGGAAERAAIRASPAAEPVNQRSIVVIHLGSQTIGTETC